MLYCKNNSLICTRVILKAIATHIQFTRKRDPNERARRSLFLHPTEESGKKSGSADEIHSVQLEGLTNALQWEERLCATLRGKSCNFGKFEVIQVLGRLILGERHENLDSFAASSDVLCFFFIF